MPHSIAGANSAVKPTAYGGGLPWPLAPLKTRFIQGHAYSNGIQFLKRCSALGLPFLRASPAGVLSFFSLLGLQPLRSKRKQLSFCKRCAASVALRFFAVRARRQMGVSRFRFWL